MPYSTIIWKPFSFSRWEQYRNSWPVIIQGDKPWDTELYLGCLNHITSFRPQGTTPLREGGWRITSGEEDLLNQLRKAHMNSQKLLQHAQAMHGLKPHPFMYIVVSSLMFSWDSWVCKLVLWMLCPLLGSFLLLVNLLQIWYFYFIILYFIIKIKAKKSCMWEWRLEIRNKGQEWPKR